MQDESKIAQMPSEESFQILRSESDAQILEQFTPEEQKEIQYKQRVLSSLAYYIGKDFDIPVKLNEPGKGWHWNFKDNEIKIDPKDLLEKPMAYLKFVISHEGGHRRISRTEFIPMEVWRQPGFSFMMNAIEDPRDNNFVAENYPKYREQMKLAYENDLDVEKEAKEKAQKKLGYQPRFMQAGFEYIKQWYREVQGKEFSLSEDLPDEVREVVAKTAESAQDSWWRYPSKEEADESEELIRQYAKVSYEINLEEVWPEFKKLVEKDQEDQKMQEFMQGMQSEKADGDGQSLPDQIEDQLTEEQQKEFKDAIDAAMDEIEKGEGDKDDSDKQKSDVIGDGQESEDRGEEGDAASSDGGEAADSGGEENEDEQSSSIPIDLDSLSDELKKKIKELMDALPEDKKKELDDRADKALGAFGKEIGDDLSGELSDDPDKQAEREKGDDTTDEDDGTQESIPEKPDDDKDAQEEQAQKQEELDEARRKMEEVFDRKDDDLYMEALREIAPLIDDLTGDLRNIFVKRKLNKVNPGHRFGRKWNIKQRIKERIEGVPLIRTESRERPESQSEEKDYAITLMFDLSGSMRWDDKIKEAFKSAIVLSETLQSLNIKFEVVGFQDKVLEFKTFDEELNDEMRRKLSQLPLEVGNDNPGGNNQALDNNDGVCLEEVSKNLAHRIEQNKFLIVLSDGSPEMRGKNSSQLDRELNNAVKNIMQNTNQKLLGIGLLSDAVSEYYPNSIANVSTEDLVETLGEVIRDLIENY